MEPPAIILEKVLAKLKGINSLKKRVVAEERADPDRTVSGWGDLELTLPLLFLEYVATNGLGYYDSFYWNPPNRCPSKYEKLKNTLRIAELEDEWSGIDLDPSQTPYIPPLVTLE